MLNKTCIISYLLWIDLYAKSNNKVVVAQLKLEKNRYQYINRFSRKQEKCEENTSIATNLQEIWELTTISPIFLFADLYNLNVHLHNC